MSKDSLEIEWEVDDGYAGGQRPHEFEIDFSEFDDCETEEEVQNRLEEIIQEEFEQNINWYCSNMDDYVKKIFTAIKEQNDE